MPDTKITNLTAKTVPVGTEEVPLNDSGLDRKITLGNLMKTPILKGSSYDYICYQSGGTYYRYNTKLNLLDDTQTNIDTFIQNINQALTIGDVIYFGRGYWPLHSVGLRVPLWCTIIASSEDCIFNPDSTFQALDIPAICGVIHDGWLGLMFPAGNPTGTNGQNEWKFNTRGGIHIYYPPSTTTVMANLGIGILIEGQSFSEQEDVYVENARIGLQVEGQNPNFQVGGMTVNNVIRHLYAKNCSFGYVGGGRNIGSSGGDGAFIHDLTTLESGIAGGGGKQRGVGVWLRNCSRVHFDFMKISNAKYCFMLDSSPEGNPDTGTTEWLEAENCTCGVYFTGSKSSGFAWNFSRYDGSTNVVYPFVKDKSIGFTQLVLYGALHADRKFCGDNYVMSLSANTPTEINGDQMMRQRMDVTLMSMVPLSAFISGNMKSSVACNITLQLFDIDSSGVATRVYTSGALAIAANTQTMIQHARNADCTYPFIQTPSGVINVSGSNPRQLKCQITASQNTTVTFGNIVAEITGIGRV